MTDHLYSKAMKFASKMNHRCGLSNIYVLQTIDKDGNVTDEKYGMNLMTDYGIQQYFISNAEFPTSLFIGDGAGVFDVSSNTLLSPITFVSSTKMEDRDTEYPLYYDSLSGIITAVSKYMKCYFDYTISGVSTDKVVSEYGIGTVSGSAGNESLALWTHSWVYDNSGRQSTITKKVGERLEITVYFCMSYNESMINTAWSNGKSIVITAMDRFYNRMTDNSIHSFKRDDSYYPRASSKTTSAFDNVTHTISKYTNLNEFTLSSGTDASSGYLDGFVNWCDSNTFSMIERELLTAPDTFDTIVYPINEHLQDVDGLTYSFGNSNQTTTPFTSMNLVKSYCFNYQTGQYDLEETFVSSNDKWYDETLMGSTFVHKIYYTVTQTISMLYLHINMNTTDPIVAIDGAVETVYATDKYWDTSSWTLVTNLTNIPQALRNCRYWITSSAGNFTPVRGLPGYKIQHDSYEETFQFINHINDVKGAKVPFVSLRLNTIDPGTSVPSQYRFFVMNNWMFRIKDYSAIDTGTASVGDKRIFAYGRTAITLGNNSNIYYTLLQPNSSSYTNSTLANLSNVNNFSQCQITESWTTTNGWGYIWAQSQSNGAVLIKVSGSNSPMSATSVPDAIAGCVIMGTDRTAHVLSTNNHVITIVERSNGSTVKTITLNSSLAAPSMLFGYNNLLYVGDGSTYTKVIDLSTSSATPVDCDGLIPFGYSNMSMAYIDQKAMVIYNRNSATYSDDVCVTYDNPSHIISLNNLTYNHWAASGSKNIQLYSCNGCIAMVVNGQIAYNNNRSCVETYDLARYIYDETTQMSYIVNDWVGIIEGDKIVNMDNTSMITNRIPHRITGSTNTISAINSLKNISAKQWEITFTNNPTWNGKPPGYEQ